ncbi:helix-turn-helix transcriptional regulator [Actinokineospora sp. 24-640]
MLRDEQPVANGIRTDHPIPNLPFVEDSHIPLEDPEEVERVGRHSGSNMWGRCDVDSETGEWRAFTTDPKNHAYAWVAHFHPVHGRSVLLYRDADGAGAYDEWFGDRALLTRLGGYWWDGDTWYRPRQVFSLSTETYVHRPVRQPTTITADDLLDSGCRENLGHLHKVLHLAPDTVAAAEQWRHDLALWAARRRARPDALPLDRCVVSLNAPELAEVTLLGVDDVAREMGIVGSTLRAYIAREETELPAPQSGDGGRKRWSRPVVLDWLEQRRRDPSNVVAVLNRDAEERLAPGLRSLWKRLSNSVFHILWDQPDTRRRWSRAHRTEQAVRSVSEELAWSAALHLDSTTPFDAVAGTLQYAVLWELSRHRGIAIDIGIDLMPNTGVLLGWFVRHKPDRVSRLFGAIMGEAERKLGIPPAMTKKSLKTSLMTNGGFNDDTWLDEFLAVTLPPER